MSQGNGGNSFHQQYAQQQAYLANMQRQQAQQVGWNLQQQQQQPQQPGRTSPAPGQVSQAALAQLQAQLNAPMQQMLLQAQQRGATPTQIAIQAQAIAQAAQSLQGRGRGGSGPSSGPGASNLAAVGSAGNLAALAAGIHPAALSRPVSASGLAGAGAGRPGMGGAGGAGGGGGLYGSRGPTGSDSDAATKLKVQAALKQLKPNEAPRVEPPEGHEWVQCMGKDGKPGWFAVVRAKAATMRSAAAAGKRKAGDDGPAGQPAGKQGGRKKAADDDLVAGGGPVNLMLMDDDAVEAEEAAAKGAVVVEAGNVQEEYLLNQNATMRLVGRLAKEGGVKGVSDAVYPYLSLAAETFLGQLLNTMVKMRLQREDMGRGYFGFEQGDTSLRAELYKMREREKREAERRAAIEREELAKLGDTRKKLGEEERKAAQAARQARDIEQKRANVGSTLAMLGIGMRGFGSMAKPQNKTGASKPGMTKTELAEVKKAAEGAPPSSSTTPAPPAAAAPGSTPPGTLDTTAAGQGLVADAQQAPGAAAGASTAAAAAATGGPAPLKPYTLQHQLLSAADVSGQAAAPFVAGGVPPRNKAVQREGGEEPLRELMLADLVAALERHPLYCRSPELYTLHTLAALQADSMK